MVEVVREVQVFDVVVPEEGTQTLREPSRPPGGCGAARDLLTTRRRQARGAGEPALTPPFSSPETAEGYGMRVLHESSIAESLERFKHGTWRSRHFTWAVVALLAIPLTLIVSDGAVVKR